MKRKYISVYLRNSDNNPSCYYRIFQYINELEKEGYYFKVNNAITSKQYFYNLEKKNKILDVLFKVYLYLCIYLKRAIAILYDALYSPTQIIVQREVFPRYMPFSLGKIYYKLIKKSNVVWDFDDNIIWNGEISKKEKKILEECSNHIVVTHEYLKNTLVDEVKNKVILLPTTDKHLSDYLYMESMNKKLIEYDRNINVIWIGTAGNLKNLDLVIEQLEYACKKIQKNYNKILELTIVSNEKYECKSTVLKINNVIWERKRARELCMSAHIGIMPLIDGEFARGKGGFKLIQYLACGLPVIASDVGFNNQIVDKCCGYIFKNTEVYKWEEAIISMASDKELWSDKSKAALQKYKDNFSYDRNTDVWKAILKRE